MPDRHSSRVVIDGRSDSPDHEVVKIIENALLGDER